MALKKWTLRIIIGLAALAMLLLGLLWNRRRQQLADVAGDPVPASLVVKSSSFPDNGRIPQGLTCDGAGSSPDIQLPDPPSQTKSFVLVVDDLRRKIKRIRYLEESGRRAVPF